MGVYQWIVSRCTMMKLWFHKFLQTKPTHRLPSERMKTSSFRERVAKMANVATLALASQTQRSLGAHMTLRTSTSNPTVIGCPRDGGQFNDTLVLPKQALRQDWEPYPGLRKKTENRYFHTLPNMMWLGCTRSKRSMRFIRCASYTNDDACCSSNHYRNSYAGSTKWFTYADAVEVVWLDESGNKKPRSNNRIPFIG